MEKTNIAELLKDCPNGMELDCTLLDNVTFDHVGDGGIWITYIDSKSEEWSLHINNDGSFPIHNLGSLPTNCVIFPKGKTTWEGFVPPCKFKDGDIVITTLGNIAIIRKHVGEESFCIYGLMVDNNFYKNKVTKVCVKRLATEEEKQQLFDAIKEHGYKWNPETKTFDKLPKFKVGDRITNGKISITIGYLTDNEYYDEIGRNISNMLSIKNQDDWELVHRKFDITTLVPFESRVLVRDGYREKWKSNFWGFYDSDHAMNHPYECCGNTYRQCIPYEGNEHLLGKTDDCDEYYKTWK